MNMRWPAGALVAGLLLLSACSDKGQAADVTTTASAPVSPTATATSTPTATASAEAEGPAEFEGQRAMEHIRVLSVDIGPRVAGSPAEKQATEYIAEQFRAFGYAVEVMEFEYQGDRFQAGQISVGGEQFEAYTMQGAPGGRVSGEAVFVGLADEAGIAGRDLAGSIAIADRGVIPFSEKLRNAEAAGAAALIVVNDEPGSFVGAVTGSAMIPAVSVAQPTGEPLRAAAEAGMEIVVDAAGSVSRSVNVIARANEAAGCEVLVGGHHDSVPGAPGALDNASGTATTLELARAFAADGLDDGLCFATFGAEESGLFGSKALAERMQMEGQLPAIMVNLDMTGLGDSVDLIGSPEPVEVANRVAEQLGIAAVPRELQAFLGSDHQSFQQAGVPVIFLTTDDLGQFHTPGDTIDTIDPDDLERAGDLAYALITEFVG